MPPRRCRLKARLPGRRAHQIRRLPVLDADKRLVGVVSVADTARASGRAKGRKAEIPADGVTATLVDICAPRTSRERSLGNDPREAATSQSLGGRNRSQGRSFD